MPITCALLNPSSARTPSSNSARFICSCDSFSFVTVWVGSPRLTEPAEREQDMIIKISDTTVHSHRAFRTE